VATIYIGVGECKASKSLNDTLKTKALGSCVAVIMLDPLNRSIGLLHAALPDSSINKNKLIERPGMFVDSGIPLLIKEMMKLGYDGKSRMIVKLAGGASIMDHNQIFNIGKRNLHTARKVLWAHKMGAMAEDVGGTISRIVTIETKTGKVTLTSPCLESWNL
jgi:chemotaxis protein CheD